MDEIDKKLENKEQQNKSFKPFLELIQALVIALVITFVIRTFVLQPFWVPTTSMVPTLKVNNRILVNEIFMRYGEVQRGDVMVFHYPLDPDDIYVKRMIALPGEILEIKEDGIYINGEKIDEPYLVQDYKYEPMGPVLVPDDSYFAMGDNRDHSADSRIWGFVPEENFIGKAFLIYWPFSDMGQIE